MLDYSDQKLETLFKQPEQSLFLAFYASGRDLGF
jgi:hypothetical protein